MKRVLTYGTFDLLHYGHINLLKRAKALGDYLIVALSTDEFNAGKGKKAFHDYFIEDTYEAGIALAGTEVKSLRMGKCSVKESFVRILNGEVYIYGMNISPYEKGNIFNRDPVRKRKLLVHKREIKHLQEQQKLQGYTLIPLQLYFKRGKVKLELGVCKGKKLYDKRDAAAAKDAKREIDRAMKSRRNSSY